MRAPSAAFETFVADGSGALDLASICACCARVIVGRATTAGTNVRVRMAAPGSILLRLQSVESSAWPANQRPGSAVGDGNNHAAPRTPLESPRRFLTTRVRTESEITNRGAASSRIPPDWEGSTCRHPAR
jgi:hypothetical protein